MSELVKRLKRAAVATDEKGMTPESDACDDAAARLAELEELAAKLPVDEHGTPQTPDDWDGKYVIHNWHGEPPRIYKVYGGMYSPELKCTLSLRTVFSTPEAAEAAAKEED